MMIRGALTVLAFFALTGAAPALAQASAAEPPIRNTFTQTVYSSIASDLPLMPGLEERADSLVIFDAPEGRIAEIAMDSPHGEVAVLAYYRETLPALGWRAENPQVWSRKNELLTIRFGESRRVIFHLQPLPPEVRNRHKSAPNW